MVTLTSLLGLAAAVVSGVLATPVPADASSLTTLDKRQQITSSQTGNNGGYYYSFYTDGKADVIYTNQNGGGYNVKWDGNGDFVCGKGWSTGSARNINYQASYGPNGNSYLAVYGWFTNPLVEYYIVESWDDYNPANGATYKGSLTSDGGTYNIYESTRYNEPSIIGTSTFNQYWSVRQNQRQSGTVTTANHFNAWHNLGLPTGTFNYQIMAVEGFSGSGEATVTVS